MTTATEQSRVFIETAISLYFQSETVYKSLREVPLEINEWILALGNDLTWEEKVVFILAIMPHEDPTGLDSFLAMNNSLNRPFTEFGGWKGISHQGFLPTGETAAFLLGIDNPKSRNSVVQMFRKEHWFYQNNILSLEGQGEAEPFLSGKLCISDEFLNRLYGIKKDDLPAKRLITTLQWEDLVVAFPLWSELQIISQWIVNEHDIRQRYDLDRYITKGYRCFFYGPPGTGKTLAASLLGKQNGVNVFRINLSMMFSKYIGETEKNIAKVFDRANSQNWILFIDEADPFFGKLTLPQLYNNIHINRELAYLKQRIEEFPGVVIISANFRENLDGEFLRKFQSVLYFPIPDEPSRLKIWHKILPKEWLQSETDELLQIASQSELSGGSIINVLRSCALEVLRSENHLLTEEILSLSLEREHKRLENLN